MTKIVLFVVLLCIARAASECVRKEDGYSSFACTCTADQCALPGDTVPELGENQALVYSNSRDEFRFKQEAQDISAPDAELEADVTITLNPSETFQKIIGFGSSFTDAAGLNVKKLSEPAQQMLLRAYFGKDGADYSVMRIPLAGSDFSTRPYSYADTPGDTELKEFVLAEEDFEYKLPYIRKSIEMSDKEMFLIASPWSPPSWMKTNGMFNGTGELLKEMYQPFANYFVRFVEEYEKEIGSPLWGLTTQNEPLSGYTDWAWNTCGWTAEDTRDWIAENLGPTLEAAGMRRLKLMVDDYNRFSLPWYPAPMVLHENSSKYVDGIALHWYDDKVIGPEVLDEMHELAPDKFMLYTEACSGWSPPHDFGVHLGSWERGEDYIKNIIEDLNHWQTGWIDWNMALNMEGGPNWANNLVDSPIVVNEEADEFYLQPTYAAMSHFSRFLQRDADRIGYEVTGNENGNIHVTAFQNPDESKVLIIANVGDEAATFGIEYPEGKLSTNLDAKSWHTVVIP